MAVTVPYPSGQELPDDERPIEGIGADGLNKYLIQFEILFIIFGGRFGEVLLSIFVGSFCENLVLTFCGRFCEALLLIFVN